MENIFKSLAFWKSKKVEPQIQHEVDPNAHYQMTLLGYASQSFDGEKNLGELGPAKNYILNYDLLRMRSWQSFIESEISQTVIRKFATWVIGAGLKMQTNPIKQVLKSEKVELNTEFFNEFMETRFSVWANSTKSDYSENRNLHKIAKTAFINSIIGGDVLVVLRVKNGIINVQLIDGCHVQTPGYGNDYNPKTLDGGNVIKNGIEMTAEGKHVKYYVRKPNNEYAEIPAYVNDMRMAYMVFGSEFRIDNSRGMPLLSVILETLKKMERYKEATVGSAEERQKIVYAIEHGNNSTGENPLLKQMGVAVNPDRKSEQLPQTVEGNQLADKVAASTDKQTFNLPIDSKMVALESKNELYFEPFYKTMANGICASINIPPEVAFSKYDSNFSASRAALKDWEHTLNVSRADFSSQFYQPIYNLFLFMNVMSQKVDAPGYLDAVLFKNFFVLEAYQSVRFIGPSIPHIDPLKEVKAIREKLGPAGANMPLTTLENATEELNGGDSDANLRQFAEELNLTNELEIVAPVTPVMPGSDTTLEES